MAILLKEECDEAKKSKKLKTLLATPSTNNSDYWDGDIDWYTPAEIGDKIFVSGSIRKITEEGLKNSSAKILPANRLYYLQSCGNRNMAILQYAGATNSRVSITDM